MFLIKTKKSWTSTVHETQTIRPQTCQTQTSTSFRTILWLKTIRVKLQANQLSNNSTSVQRVTSTSPKNNKSEKTYEKKSDSNTKSSKPVWLSHDAQLQHAEDCSEDNTVLKSWPLREFFLFCEVGIHHCHFATGKPFSVRTDVTRTEFRKNWVFQKTTCQVRLPYTGDKK